MYAGALGDNAVERYALFLASLELAGTAEERRAALGRAQEHGLDVERVAVVTAERTIEKAFTVRAPSPFVMSGKLICVCDCRSYPRRKARCRNWSRQSRRRQTPSGY